jgi:hypothetical protein
MVLSLSPAGDPVQARAALRVDYYLNSPNPGAVQAERLSLTQRSKINALAAKAAYAESARSHAASQMLSP